MGGIGETVDLTLTQVAAPNAKILLTAVAGKNGAPTIELGSTPREVTDSGQRDQVRIDTQHGGSGQKVGRNPAKYLIANGWMTDETGLLTPRGAKSEVVVTTDAGIFAGATRRGALFAVGGEPYVAVTPKAIFEGISPALKREPADTDVFTGSHARFGNRVFFGTEDQDTGEGRLAEVRISAGDVVPVTEFPLDSGSSSTVAADVLSRKLTSGPAALAQGTPTPIQHTHLTTLDDIVSRSAYSTDSISPSGDTLILAVVANESAAGGELPVVTGNSLTWTQVSTKVSEKGRLTVFRAMSVGSTPASGAVTATFASDHWSCRIIISEFANVDTSDAGGANAILQPTTGEGTGSSGSFGSTKTVDLEAFSAVGNSTFGAFFAFRQDGSQATSISIAAELTWAKIAETSAGSSRCMTEWRDANDRTVSAVIKNTLQNSTYVWLGLGVELVQATAGATPLATYVTKSISPIGDKLQIIAVQNTLEGGSAAAPAVAGNGITWTLIDSQVFNGTEYRISLFRGMVSSPTAGPVTITFGGVAQTSCAWSILEFGNVDTGGTHGSAAVVQSAKNSSAGATSLTVTLAGGSADNATLGAFSTNGSDGINVGSGFTELHEVLVTGTLQTEWRDDFVTSVAASASVSVVWGGIAIEIKPAGVSGTYQTGSISPAKDRLVLAAIHSTSGTVDTPTLAGNNLTWVEVATVTQGTERLTLFRALGSETPEAGPVAIDFGGVAQTRVRWAISEFSGVDKGGDDGADAVVQSVTKTDAAASLLSIALAALGDANNATYGAFAASLTDGISPGSLFTEIHEVSGGGATLMTEKAITGADPVDAFGTTSNPGAVTVGATITFDKQNSTSLDPSTLTMSHTIDSGANCLVIAIAVPDDKDLASAPTWNGAAMTLLNNYYANESSARRIIMYYTLLPSGTHDIVVTMASGSNGRFGLTAVNLIGVSQSTPFGAVDQSKTVNGQSVTSATIGAPSFLLSAFIMGGSMSGADLQSGQTALDGSAPGAGDAGNDSVSSAEFGMSYKPSETGTIGYTFYISGSRNWAQIAVPVNAGTSTQEWIGVGLELQRILSADGDYITAGFDANYLTTVGSRMFRLRYDQADELWFMSWTDHTGTDDPAWSTEYPVTGAKRKTGDLVTLGPNALAGLSVTDMPAEFLSMDTEGSFTPLVPEGLGITDIVAAAPFLNGQLFLLSGVSQILWFRDLLDIALLPMNPSPPDDALNAAVASSDGAVTGYADTIWAIANGQIVYGSFKDEQWVVNQFEVLATGEIPLAIRVWPDNSVSQIKVDVLLRMAANDIRIRTYQLYNKFTFPTPDSDTKVFTSSVFQGVWVSKEARRLRGYVTVDTGTLTIEALIDGVSAGSVDITTSGPFALDLAGVGRGIQVRLTCTNFMGSVELPLEVDFFYIPARQDILRIAVQLGEHMTRGASLDIGNYVDDFETIQAAIASPETWALHFGDNRDDWTVIPLDLSGRESAPESKPGNQQGVHWLTLQRI